MSRGLGQGELLDPPKPKRLLVGEGATCWWGCDPSTVRVALASIDAAGQRGVTLRPFPGLDEMARLPEIAIETRACALELLDAGLRPGVLAIERPAAPKNRPVNPALYYAVGTIAAVLQLTVLEETARRVECVLVTGSSWKALACGQGNIGKPKKDRRNPKPEDYPVLVWAQGLGYQGTSWDAADAYGIAEWARRTYALEAR
jgi:hypothetical protein